MNSTLILAAAGFLAAFGYATVSGLRASSLQFPPSPPSDPLIGHARKLPTSRAWQVYSKWKQLYGDVIYAHAFGRSIVVLNSITAARDLLEKRSLAFSDRPFLPVINLSGWENALSFLQYGERFRKHRRMMHQHFGPQALQSFRIAQEHELRKFLLRLRDSPNNFLDHIHSFVAGVVILNTYGHEVATKDDAYVELVERVIRMTVSFGSAGTTIIDMFPFLRYLPAWLPGMGLKRFALKTCELVDLVRSLPYEEVKAKMTMDSASPCVISKLLTEYEQMNGIDPEHEEDIMNIGAITYAAGTDTTKSMLSLFFLLMATHSDAARQAQEEIDSVVGTDRLPTIDDREQLPYIDCILKEMYRLHPPAPLGLPHRSTQTEQYRDWTIPSGTIVIANIRQMMRDETVYPEPELFKPERHAGKGKSGHTGLDDDIRASAAAADPRSIVFGFGRRVCPGKYFADSTLWLTIANVFAMFDIIPCNNPVTNAIELPKLEFEGEITLTPKPFVCTIIPRNARLAHALQTDSGYT